MLAPQESPAEPWRPARRLGGSVEVSVSYLHTNGRVALGLVSPRELLRLLDAGLLAYQLDPSREWPEHVPRSRTVIEEFLEYEACRVAGLPPPPPVPRIVNNQDTGTFVREWPRSKNPAERVSREEKLSALIKAQELLRTRGKDPSKKNMAEEASHILGGRVKASTLQLFFSQSISPSERKMLFGD